MDEEKLNALRKQAKGDKKARTQLSKLDFPAAKELAGRAGFELLMLSDHHYQLRGPWMINVWPSTQKWMADPNHAKPPPIPPLEKPWTILDLVEVVIGSVYRGAWNITRDSPPPVPPCCAKHLKRIKELAEGIESAMITGCIGWAVFALNKRDKKA